MYTYVVVTLVKLQECQQQQQVGTHNVIVTRQKNPRRSEDLMVFLFQVSTPSANHKNKPNSVKAQIQCETIEPLTILCSVPDITHFIGKTLTRLFW